MLSRFAKRLSSSTKKGLSYEIVKGGQIDVNKIQTAVILHGMLGSKQNWRNMGKRIVKDFPKWQVILVDHRGHGDSPSFDPPHNLEAAALDIKTLMSNLNLSAQIVIGHSFGGKVALSYTQLCDEIGDGSIPDGVWVLDSIPRELENASPSDKGESVDQVISVLKSIQLPIPSREHLLQVLRSHNFSEGLCLWMTTNIKVADKGYIWRFNIDIAELLFKSFLKTSFYPLLHNPPLGCEINIVRASRNPMWTANDLLQMKEFNKRNHNIHFHTLEGGHWLHVDNFEGLYKLMTPSFQS